ncbi:MAG: glycosyltransferase family 4 protein [Candidatus Eremiobacteraeota bacterium]|nr:glycosyltransferase family 4 protein [Candidatus Eremiobacteraeota bacterium]
MKIALISAKFPFGPKEPYLEAEIRALSEYIEDLTIIPTSPPRRPSRHSDLPAKVVRMPLISLRTYIRTIQLCCSQPGAVLRALRSIIMPRARFTVRLKNLVIFPKALAVADIVQRENIDHIHSYWLSTPSTVAYIAAQIAGKPWSSTAHRWDIYENNLAHAKAKSAAFMRVISRRGLSDYRKRIGVVHWERSVALHLGVRVPPQRAAYPLAARHRPLTLLCAAAFVPVKGHKFLIEALAQVRDSGYAVRCYLAGDGPLKGRIAALIRKHRLSAVVTILSEVPHHELMRQLQSGMFDAAVLPSIEREDQMEGIPVALMEAMAVGLPCIATNSGSVTELLDASCGIVVPQGSSGALADAIITLARDVKRGSPLGVLARRRVAEQYDARQTAAVLSALLRRPEMLEEHSGEFAEMKA